MIANDLIDLLALCRWKIIALYSLSQFEVIIKVKQATRGHSRNKVSPIAVIPAGTLLLPLNKLKQLQTLIVTR